MVRETGQMELSDCTERTDPRERTAGIGFDDRHRLTTVTALALIIRPHLSRGWTWKQDGIR